MSGLPGAIYPVMWTDTPRDAGSQPYVPATALTARDAALSHILASLPVAEVSRAWDSPEALVEAVQSVIRERHALRERVAELEEAVQAFKDFDDMPTSHKRPDVFELMVRRKLLAALTRPPVVPDADGGPAPQPAARAAQP